jgi:hypothetical protein
MASKLIDVIVDTQSNKADEDKIDEAKTTKTSTPMTSQQHYDALLDPILGEEYVRRRRVAMDACMASDGDKNVMVSLNFLNHVRL